jgi:hypothetical protein
VASDRTDGPRPEEDNCEPPVEPGQADGAWTEDQLARRRLLEAGQAVLANKSRPKQPSDPDDRRLIGWAKARNLAIEIGRPGPWGNPVKISATVTRNEAVEAYRQHLQNHSELLARIDELKGRVLICSCTPLRCHGDVLLEALAAAEQPGNGTGAPAAEPEPRTVNGSGEHQGEPETAPAAAPTAQRSVKRSFMQIHGQILVDRGYPIIPIRPGAKCPGSYDRRKRWGPLSGWNLHCTRLPTAEELALWQTWPGCGIGIACGIVGGLDIDVLDAELNGRIEKLARDMLGDTPTWRVGRAPKKLLPYRQETPFGKIIRPSIEWLGRGAQFVAYGIHPDTQQPYHWPLEELSDIDIERLPLVSQEQVERFMDRAPLLLPPELVVGRIRTNPVAEGGSRRSSNPRGTHAATAEALAHIPNDVVDDQGRKGQHYDLWIIVGLATKGSRPEDGFELWDAWSQRSSKYDPAKTEKTWRSLNPREIGFGTLQRLAAQYGWKPDPSILFNEEKELAAMSNPAEPFLAKVRSGAKDRRQRASSNGSGAEGTQGHPGNGGAGPEAETDDEQAEAEGEPAGGDENEDDAQAEAAYTEEPDPEAKPKKEIELWDRQLRAKVAKLNRDMFVTWAGNGRAVVIRVNDYDSVTKRRVHGFLKADSVKLVYDNDIVQVGWTQRGYRRLQGLGTAWLQHWQRRTYLKGMALLPGQATPPDTYNLWHGFGVTPKPGSWATIEFHLRHIICRGREDDLKYVLDWSAYCVQHPGRPAETAIVMRGEEGTGKGLFAKILLNFFRDHGFHVTSTRQLTGNFNAHLLDTLMVFADEIQLINDRAAVALLKTLVTESVITIEPKGVDSFSWRNATKLIISSNSDFVVPAGAHSRRFYMLDVSKERLGDEAYFKALAAAAGFGEGSELAAFLHHLLHERDLSGFNIRKVRHTAALGSQKLMAADITTKWLYDALCEGTLNGINDWRTTIPKNMVWELIGKFARSKNKAMPDRQVIAKRLKALSGGSEGVAPIGFVDGERSRKMGRAPTFVLAPLAEHRTAFLKAMQIPEPHDWDGDDDARTFAGDGCGDASE